MPHERNSLTLVEGGCQLLLAYASLSLASLRT